MHREGCAICNKYATHAGQVAKKLMVVILSYQIDLAFWMAWPQVVAHMEEETMEEVTRRTNWYCDCNEDLARKAKTAEDKLFSETDHICTAQED